MALAPGSLTSEELGALDLTADLARRMASIIGKGAGASVDLHEALLHIHGLQHMIMSQSAARAYPERFRLLGERAIGGDA